MSFGTSKSETNPLFKRVGGTTLRDGNITLDPLIAQREASALGIANQAVGDFGGQLSQLRERAIGSLPDYINAAVNPLRASQAAQRGNLATSLARRGVAGSSFANQAQRGQAIDFNRALQDAIAGATASGVGQIAGLSQMGLESEMKRAEFLKQLAQMQAQRELAGITTTGGKSSGFNVGLNTNPIF